jgi:hypothetical protein
MLDGNVPHPSGWRITDKATGDAIILLSLRVDAGSLTPSLADIVLLNAIAHLEGRPADGPSTAAEVEAVSR